MMNTCAGRDDIDDGIHCTNFVKVDLVDRDVVNLCFGVAEALEGSNSCQLDGLVQRRVLDNVSDDGQRTTMKVALWLRVAVRLVDVVLIVAVWNAGLVQMLCFLLLPVGKLGIGRPLDGVVSFMLVGVSWA
jgi:hypothetical protein